jgi:hypothetical protein
LGIEWAFPALFPLMALSADCVLGRNLSSRGITKHPTAVVVQNPVMEWLRWLDALTEFIEVRDWR